MPSCRPTNSVKALKASAVKAQSLLTAPYHYNSPPIVGIACMVRGWSMVYVTVRHPSVYLSVPAWTHICNSSKPPPTGGIAAVGPAGRRYRLTAVPHAAANVGSAMF